MNMLSGIFPFPVFPTCLSSYWPVSSLSCFCFQFTRSPDSTPTPASPPLPFLSRRSAPFLQIWEVVNIFLSHLIIYMNDSNSVSVLAYVQAFFFFNSESVSNRSGLQSIQCLTAHLKRELVNDTTLLSLEKRQISWDTLLSAEGFLCVLCKAGAVNPACCSGLYDFCHSFLNQTNAV